MRLSYGRRPLRTTGDVARRKSVDRQRVRGQVLTRSGTRCELCGHRTAELEGHHVWRRSSVAGIPAVHCEAPESIVAVCINDPRTGHVGCHERIHAGDAKLEHKARWLALSRFTERWGLVLGELFTEAGPDLVDVMRACCRRLEEMTGA